MKNKKALDNHMWRDHQKENYLKCRLWPPASHYDNLKKHMSVACCLMPSEALWACCKAWNTEKWEGPNGQHLRCSSLGWPFYHTNREGIMLITCIVYRARKRKLLIGARRPSDLVSISNYWMSVARSDGTLGGCFNGGPWVNYKAFDDGINQPS